MIAFGKEVALEKLSQNLASILESLGALMFLTIAVVGFVAGGYFFLNFFLYKGKPFDLFSAGIIPLCNIAICLKVGAGLFAIFVALTLFKQSEKR
jgi:multicomponent Na+:H+ antiporter subunit B